MKILFAIIICSIPFFSFSQKTSVIKNVKGEGRWEIVGDVSPRQAQERALLEAKKDALRKAGVGIDVKSFNFSSIVGGNETVSDEKFTQLNSIVLEGQVRLTKPIEVTKERIHTGNDEVIVRIVANVVNSAKTDPEFVLDVKGIEPIYKSEEKLTFSVTPHKNCYLRVFLFDNIDAGNGFVVYPLYKYNNDIILNEMNTYGFPLSRSLEPGKDKVSYVMEKSSAKQYDDNIIFVVATKKQIPFIGDVTFERFFEWYYNIPANERSDIFARQMIVK